MTQGLIWLASYPKSGNTWFRFVLANILSDRPLGINEMNVSHLAADRALFVEALGFNSYLLSEEELWTLRYEVYIWLSQKKQDVQYVKIHDAYQSTLIPSACSLGVIYCIRNPLDVVVSYAHHSNISIDECIALLCYPQAKIYDNIRFLGTQLQQHLFSWSDHVRSWTVESTIPVHCIRYEDMHKNPFLTFKQAFKFLQLNHANHTIQTAIHEARFEKLQQQELEQNFREKFVTQKKFFRKGIVGDWENTLNRLQIEKIIHCHDEVMFKHGYLDKQGKPVKETEKC